MEACIYIPELSKQTLSSSPKIFQSDEIQPSLNLFAMPARPCLFSVFGLIGLHALSLLPARHISSDDDGSDTDGDDGADHGDDDDDDGSGTNAECDSQDDDGSSGMDAEADSTYATTGDEIGHQDPLRFQHDGFLSWS